ncbi:MAG: acyl--CoA ligase, partial [Deltaproteobacteria bacterium]|nr:acyl--CoA ligase [Deltaproteobacteria bacterium]
MPIPGLEKNIGVLLEKSAAQHGAKKAMLFDHENTVFTYAELNSRVNQFANVFVAKGIKQKDHVAVMLPNCPEFPVTWLALAKLGAVMVPLNVRYQAAELEYVLN